MIAVASALDHRFTDLKTLLLLCIVASEAFPLTPLSKSEAFATAMSKLCTAPVLRTFHFCTHEGCVTHHNWGMEDATIVRSVLRHHEASEIDTMVGTHST